MVDILSNKWALIIGGSSGLGLASALKLSKEGFKIIILHRDTRSHARTAETHFAKIRTYTKELITINSDATDPANIAKIVTNIKERLLPDEKIRFMLHSIASGNIFPLYGQQNTRLLSPEDIAQTISSMGISLATWVHLLHQNLLFSNPASVVSLSSEGAQIAIPSYAAVSAAKSTLESISRSIAVEYAESGIRSNILRPGVTDTAALKLIPNHLLMLKHSAMRNPYRRNTTTEDVANAVSLLAKDEALWINGTIIPVDGGEHISTPSMDIA